MDSQIDFKDYAYKHQNIIYSISAAVLNNESCQISIHKSYTLIVYEFTITLEILVAKNPLFSNYDSITEVVQTLKKKLDSNEVEIKENENTECEILYKEELLKKIKDFKFQLLRKSFNLDSDLIAYANKLLVNLSLSNQSSE